MRNQRTVLILAVVLVLVAGVLASAGSVLAAKDSPNAWVPGPTAPWAYWRFDGHYYAPQGRVYFLGGRTGAAATINPRVWYFDAATSTFVDTGTDMPTGVANYHIVELTDATGPGLFVFGGSTAAGTYSTDVQVYRPESNTAALVAGDTWPGMTNTACVDFPGAAATYNNKAYLMGGFNGSCATPGVSAETWVYDPMGTAGARFTAGPALSQARGYLQASIVDNFLYAIGGDQYPAGALEVTPVSERLDLTNPVAWDDAAVADMPVLAASGFAGCDEVKSFGFNTGSASELAGKIVIPGCGQWSAEYADSFIYDVATNTWADWEPLTIARRNYAAAMVYGPSSITLWIFGGRSGSDNGIDSTEFRTVAVTPTAVKLVGMDSYSQPALPLWALGLAGLALLGATGVGVARARARA